MMRALLAAAVSFFIVSPAATSGVTMQGGQWEITSRGGMTGMEVMGRRLGLGPE